MMISISIKYSRWHHFGDEIYHGNTIKLLYGHILRAARRYQQNSILAYTYTIIILVFNPMQRIKPQDEITWCLYFQKKE